MRPYYRRDEPSPASDDTDFGERVIRLQEERSSEDDDETYRVLVKHDEQQHQQAAEQTRAGEEFVEREDDGFCKRSRRCIVESRLGSEHRCDHSNQHQRRKNQVDGRPWQMSGEHERQEAGEKQSDAVSEYPDCGAGAHFAVVKHVGSICIARHILRRTEKSDQDGVEGEQPETERGVVKRHRRDRNEQQHLRDHEPAAASSKEWRYVAIEQRSPEELERIGKSDEAEQSYRREVHIRLSHPGL